MYILCYTFTFTLKPIPIFNKETANSKA